MTLQDQASHSFYPSTLIGSGIQLVQGQQSRTFHRWQLTGAGMMDTTIDEKRRVEINNRALVRKACDAWKEGTGTPYDLLAEDMTWTIVGKTVVPVRYTSKASFIEEVMKPFASRIDGRLTPTVHAIYAEGTRVVLWADVDGVAIDGKPYHNSYSWFLELQENEVTRVVAFVDVDAFNELFERITPA
jgi:ketosteroid isomerase-like protein